MTRLSLALAHKTDIICKQEFRHGTLTCLLIDCPACRSLVQPRVTIDLLLTFGRLLKCTDTYISVPHKLLFP